MTSRTSPRLIEHFANAAPGAFVFMPRPGPLLYMKRREEARALPKGNASWLALIHK